MIMIEAWAWGDRRSTQTFEAFTRFCLWSFLRILLLFALRNFTCLFGKAECSTHVVTEISKPNHWYIFFLGNNIYKDSPSLKFDSKAGVGVDLTERKVGSYLTCSYYSSLKVAEISTLGDSRVAIFCTEMMWRRDQMKSCCSLIDELLLWIYFKENSTSQMGSGCSRSVVDISSSNWKQDTRNSVSNTSTTNCSGTTIKTIAEAAM